MRTVTLEIASQEASNARFLKALNGEEQGAFVSFESPALLFKVLSGKRWDLLKMMTGAGPLSIREASRRLQRDVKAVHGDMHALVAAGIIQRTEDGKMLFPFDAIHVDFLLKAA